MLGLNEYCYQSSLITKVNEKIGMKVKKNEERKEICVVTDN